MIKKQNNGITLIALVITIIAILILSGVAIATFSGENGVLTKANKAIEEQFHSEVKEAIILAYNAYKIEYLTSKEIKSETDVATINREIKLAGLKPTDNLKKEITFKEYMIQKEYMTKEGHIAVEKLLGKEAKFGNGTNKKDEYVWEEKIVESTEIINNESVVKTKVIEEITYYDKSSKPTTIWSGDETEIEMMPPSHS